jgi:GNAT superfamily N-acetyltransferase
MNIQYEVIDVDQLDCIKALCNDLMAFQKSKATIHPEFFDNMRFETRMIPSFKSSKENYMLIAKDNDNVIGYAYSTIAPKTNYSGGFATLSCDAFFDFDSVTADDVGCLSQFYLIDGYRSAGIGSQLFEKSMSWLHSFDDIQDIFIFVSNGNNHALNFYLNKGFKYSHEILEGFIIVLRNDRI